MVLVYEDEWLLVVNKPSGLLSTPGRVENTDNDWNNAVIYDMQGRRVQSMDKKGVYIINGKKVVNK